MTERPEIDEVAAAYDSWAGVYDSTVNRTRDLDAVVLRRQSLALHGANVLEIGCGTGKNSVWLAESAASLIALDFSNGMLRKARERVATGRAHFVRHDVREPWPVEPTSIDVVVSNLVLEHVHELAPFFSEAARVLRSGGRLFTSELHPFRQLAGAQAQFVREGGQTSERVRAYLHDVSDYVNGGLAAGLTLVELGEWCDEGAQPTDVPRLLTTSWLHV